MNFHELDNFNLSDTVKYHNRLNRRLWGRDEHLLPDVRDKLLEIAEDFREFLGVDDLRIQDITLSGSNAAYNYTNNSDIDLHLVVDMPNDPVYQELFNAKKYQYNNEHNLVIGGADVELYVQPADQPHVSQGIYSVRDGKWIQVPRRKRAQIDDSCVRDKAADLDARIHAAVGSGDADAISALVNKIKVMRQTGLEQHGEFGCENIVFKVLRDQGCIKLLKDAYLAARDHELSLAEQNREKGRVTYGFSNRVTEDVTITPDGVSASTRMFLSEKGDEDNQAVNDFIQHVVKELGIDPAPEIVIHTDPEWSEGNHSFGRYEPESNTLNVSMPNRHILDVFRTIAHELVHCDQHQKQGGLPPDAGETGSEYENDANARAGIIMRDFAAAHPEYFGQEPLGEGASGYIPKNKREAAMPQYAMALSVDVKPGQTGVEANKMALQTGPNGEPTLLMKNLRNALREFKETGRLTEEQDLFEINMGGKNLRREAAKTGALAGMEFEMIVPNTQGDDDDQESEPDFDTDDRASGPQDIRDFFYDRDLNSRGDVDRLIDRMMEDYTEWQSEEFSNRWDSDSEQFIYDYIRENLDEDDIRTLLDLEPDDELTKKEYQLAADKIAAERLEPWYEDAENDSRDQFYEDDQFEDWLADEGLTHMSDIFQRYDSVIQWPYWHQGSRSGEGASVQETAESFSQAVGRPARASDSYHAYGQERPAPGKNFYVVEPDGSLEPDDMDDAGLEFVSPPLPIDEIMSDLNKVKKWADLNGCYTNDSTGLHINISVPNYDLDKLDFVKLALLMGDEYVLNQFGRASNTYAKSAMGKVRDHVQKRPYEAKYLLDKMKGHMGELASKAIHSGSTDKYTSINTKDGHIEFRSPGGDWLGDNFDKIENTLLRFTVALSAAMDPKAYREEYLKKLYKILNVGNDKGDLVNMFARYSAGLLPADALKSFVRQVQAERKAKKSGEDIVNGIRWRVSLKPELGGGVVEVMATDPIDAKKQAIIQQPNWRFVDDDAMTIERLDEPAAGASTTAPHPQGRGRPNDPNGRYAIVRRDDQRNYRGQWGSEAPDYLFKFSLPDDLNLTQTNDRMRAVMAAWAARENANAADYMVVDTTQFAQPAAPESGSVRWNIINRDNETVHTFWNRNVQADANAAARQWLTNNGMTQSFEGPFEVVPAAIPGSTQDLQRQRMAAAASDITNPLHQSPTPVAGVQDIEPDVEQYTSQPAQTQWEVYDRSTDRPVFRMYAADQAEAWRKGQEWVANYARMTPDQPIDPADYSVRQSAQPVTEATGDKRFDAMMGQIQREPAIPDSQMPPTDVKDLYAWAVKNNKPYHKIFAEWANREGYKSVAPALQKAGDLDSDALDYWTPDVWKIWYGPDSEMPQGWSKERVPDELRDYLETVFDAYDRIVFDWPTEYRQIGEQGMAEGQETYLSPNMKAVPNQDPNSSEDHDYYYKDQQIKPGDPFHSQIKDLHLRQLDPTYDAFRNAFDNPLIPGPAVPQQQPQGDTIIPSRPVPPEKIKGPDGKPLKLKDIIQLDPPLSENFADGRHPEDKGDSKRYHVPTKSSVSNLRKFAKNHSGRAAQLAHWMSNMKSGKRKTNETVIGNLHFPQLTIAVDDHAIDRTRTRGIDPHTIDQSLRKLNAVADQLAQIEPNAQIWAYDAENNLGLGLRRISSRDMLFKLKTVVADRPFDGAIPIIELS